METETITLEVDPETARRFREAKPERRKLLGYIVAEELGQPDRAPTSLLRDIRHASAQARRENPHADAVDRALGERPTSVDVALRAGEEAIARGMTEDVLQRLLSDG